MCTKKTIIETRIRPYFGKKKLNEIGTADVIHWQNTMMKFVDPVTGKKYSKSYLKTLHNQLSAALNYAVKYYDLPKNPAEIVGNMGSDKNIDLHFWTLDQYQKFAEAMMDYPVYYYCFEVLYWCGIREGELLALTMDDFDFEKKILSITKTFHHLNGRDYVTDPKTKKSKRNVDMPDFLCDEIQDYIKQCYDLKPDERLFPVSKTSLTNAMKKGTKLAGLPHIRVHDLRHSHVSLLIDKGYSAVAIAERVGHESVEITYRYAHLFPTTQKNMAATLDNLKGDN